MARFCVLVLGSAALPTVPRIASPATAIANSSSMLCFTTSSDIIITFLFNAHTPLHCKPSSNCGISGSRSSEDVLGGGGGQPMPGNVAFLRIS